MSTEYADIPGQLDLLAHARSTDPDTSHAAAASITQDQLRASQWAVLRVLRLHPGGLTDDALARVYGTYDGLPMQSASGLRTRRKELVRAGLVADTGERTLLASRRRSIVWHAVDA